MSHSNPISQCRFLTVLALLAMSCPLAPGLPGRAGATEPATPAREGAVKELFRIEAKGYVPCGIMAPDGKTFAYCDPVPDGEVAPPRREFILIDLATGKELRRRRMDSFRGGVFSADGQFLAVATPDSDAAATIWNAARWAPKAELKLPEGHRFSDPLAFSPDGKLVAGRADRRVGDRWLPESLVLWDTATGACRVLGPGAAKLLSRGGPFGNYGNRGGKEDPVPVRGPFVGVELLAVTFPDTGAGGVLFAEYEVDGIVFITAWDTTEGKPLRTEWCGSSAGRELRHSGLARMGGTVPGSPADLYRFRMTPRGHILVLPKYGAPPIIAVPHADGSCAVAVTPAEDRYGDTTPYPNRPLDELCRLEDYKGATVRLTPDGKRIVALSIDPRTAETKRESTVLRAWDVSALHPLAKQRLRSLSGEKRERLWGALFADDSDPDDALMLPHSRIIGMPQFSTLQAMASLASHPDDAVPWLRKMMGPPYDPKAIPGLIEDLDSDDFMTRERASHELERLGPITRASLQGAKRKDLSAEKKRRIDDLLDKIQPASAYEMRQLRIIDVLEHIPTSAAHDLLKAMAEGAYDPAFAEEAKQALRCADGKR